MQNNNLLFDWQKIQLKEICSNIYSGGTPSTKDESYWNGNILWLSSGEIKKRYIISSNQKITQKGVDNSSTKLARENDVLIASAGQGYTRGNVAFCLIDTYINQSLISLRTDKRICSEKFLFFNLMDRYDELRNLSDSNSSRGSLTCEMMGKLPIYLPPLPTQQKIATILSAYDDLIENNTRRIKILEEMAQAIYREWFVNFRFPGHEGVRMVESELGLVPEGWEVVTVEETFEISGGGTPSTKVPEYWESGTINWYSPVDLTASGTMFMEHSGNQINELGLKKSSARIFPPFSVMMTSRATLGVISINTTDACTNQGFITCIPNEHFPLYTLYHWLKENVETFISLGTGSTFKEITKGVFKTIQLVVPSPEPVSQFEKTVQPLALQILNLQRKNANLRRTRDLLLPKLISGELDVSGLDIDIPADL